MVKDHSDSKREISLLPLHGLLFVISSKKSFICTISRDRIVHTMVFVIPVVGALHGMRNSSMDPL